MEEGQPPDKNILIILFGHKLKLGKLSGGINSSSFSDNLLELDLIMLQIIEDKLENMKFSFKEISNPDDEVKLRDFRIPNLWHDILNNQKERISFTLNLSIYSNMFILDDSKDAKKFKRFENNKLKADIFFATIAAFKPLPATVFETFSSLNPSIKIDFIILVAIYWYFSSAKVKTNKTNSIKLFGSKVELVAEVVGTKSKQNSSKLAALQIVSLISSESKENGEFIKLLFSFLSSDDNDDNTDSFVSKSALSVLIQVTSLIAIPFVESLSELNISEGR